MKTFSFTGAKKIVFGRGSFAALPEHIAELKILRPLIVLDRNLAETGFREKVDGILAKELFNALALIASQVLAHVRRQLLADALDFVLTFALIRR